mgnify:FL=1
MSKELTMLIIMDGFGISDEVEGNAVKAAKTPVLTKLMNENPTTLIDASGRAVGLPDGQMGNSEVGHLNLGAGRIIDQELMRITRTIEDGSFFDNKVLKEAIAHAKEFDAGFHIYGLISPGGVHSHTDHLLALVKMAKAEGLKKIYIHCFMDGRDVPPSSGKGYIEDLEKNLAEIGAGEIASVSGRYYAMDRDNRWERVEKAYAAMVYGEGDQASSAAEAMQKAYDAGVTDEFVVPCVIQKNGKPVATIQDNDSIVFFNFRPDRAREITRAMVFDDFDGFARRGQLKNIYYVTMTQYDESFAGKVHVAFEPAGTPKNMLAEYISNHGMKQLHIAETEKYAHVTFFFNNGLNDPFPGEDRILIPSPKVATYDLKPSMSAYEVTDAVVEQIQADKYDVIILNFANCDMVGHTGVFSAAVEAVETVDTCIGKIMEALQSKKYNLFVTADHGNAEKMIDPVTKQPHTAHTTNKVPLIFISNLHSYKLAEGGKLADIAPSMLDAMGMEIPVEMTGKSLIVK